MSGGFSLSAKCVSALIVAGTFAAFLAPIAASAQVPNVGGQYYCPSLTVTLKRGSRDSTTGGQVSELQRFISSYYNVRSSEIVTGYFGPKTESYVKRFQTEQSLPSIGVVGPMTRAKIAQVCRGGGGGGPIPSSVTMTATPLSGTAPLVVAFAINVTPGTCVSYLMDYGDGATENLSNFCGTRTLQHTYPSQGNYSAHFDQLTVVNGQTVRSVKAQAAISVGAVQVVAPTCTMTASKTSIRPNESVTVTWTSTHATSAQWSGGATTGTSGSAIFTDIATTTTKMITFTGSGGTKVCSVTINVTQPPEGTVVMSGNAIANGGTANVPSGGQTSFKIAEFTLTAGSQEAVTIKKIGYTVRNQRSGQASTTAATLGNYRMTIGTSPYTPTITKDGIYDDGTVSPNAVISAGGNVVVSIFVDISAMNPGNIDLWIYPEDIQVTGNTTNTNIKPSSTVTNRVDSALLYWSGWISTGSGGGGGGTGNACYMDGVGYAAEPESEQCKISDWLSATGSSSERCRNWHTTKHCTADGWVNVSWGGGYINPSNVTVGCTTHNGLYVPGNMRVRGNRCFTDEDANRGNCEWNYVCKRDGWWRLDGAGFELEQVSQAPWVAPETFSPPIDITP